MSKRQEFRDNKGHIIGWMKTESTETTLHDARGHLLGRYNPRMNKTTNARGSYVGSGNMLMTLLT